MPVILELKLSEMQILKVSSTIVLALLFLGSGTSIVRAQVDVEGYYRDDGTYVEGHQRTEPDNSLRNNYSYPGNYNPNTGEITDGNPSTYRENHEQDGYEVDDYEYDNYEQDDYYDRR